MFYGQCTGALSRWNKIEPLNSNKGQSRYTRTSYTNVCFLPLWQLIGEGPHMGVYVRGPRAFGQSVGPYNFKELPNKQCKRQLGLKVFCNICNIL